MAVTNKNDIYFLPSDVSSVLDISEWTHYLAEIIIEIRKNSMAELSKQDNIISQIQDLISYNETHPLSKNSDALTLFNVYQKIIKISLNLRKSLKKYVPSLDIYDEIHYSLYYDDKRYFVEHLKAEWLSVNSKGQLMLQMDKAIEDLEKGEQEGKDNQKAKIREILFNHYTFFLNAIKGTYKGYFGESAVAIGKRGSKINKGRVSEGFEEHLVEHHHWIYKNNLELTADNPIYAIEKRNATMKQWKDHESINKAWMHIKHSLGTQRGTVAGDVGDTQVKQIQKTGISSFDRIRLASLGNLMDGIIHYSKILDKTKDPYVVAFEIAKYLSEPVSEKAADLLNIKGNDTYIEMLPEDLKQLRNKRKVVKYHI